MNDDITSPGPNDVISGRGNFANLHHGNKFFRYLTRQYKVEYVSGTDEEKKVIAQVIVKTIRDLDPPGRFLKLDPKTKLYYDIGDKRAYAKTSQALREGAPYLLQSLAQNPQSGSPESSDVLKPQEKNNTQMQTKHLESERTMAIAYKFHEPTVPTMDMISLNNYPGTSLSKDKKHTHQKCLGGTCASTAIIASSHSSQYCDALMSSACCIEDIESVERFSMSQGIGSFSVESFGEVSISMDKIFNEKSLLRSSKMFENENYAIFEGKVVSLMSEMIMEQLSLSFNSLGSLSTETLEKLSCFLSTELPKLLNSSIAQSHDPMAL